MWDSSPVISKYIVPPHPALFETLKKSASALRISWHPGYDIIFSFAAPFYPGLIRCLIGSVSEGGHKFTNIGLVMGVTIVGNATKSGKKTHLLVIMRREDLAENRYLHNLANRTSIQKRKWLETTYRIYIRDYCGKNSYHNTYAHLITTPPQPTNFDLLGVCDVPKFNLQITPTDSTSTHVIPPAVVSGPKSDSPPTNNQGPLN